ncbi:Uncharacterised protein [Mycobacterium tuberculosis]|uniref:Uncharacterized protein n=1 Tax=Mycobacterium tuberculosis TaxID=1773 RepID=A0A916LGY1_MYCTX|nr:Uncharacterised protein [Mycobacterium tuberculosis]COW33712.1 Uncharacterised protein [Mycobacterium tuberculosis]COZ25771.1 Uncharacterised protein [Mycobacterium tuberculosis]CPB74533.1 Uncharacterised protein [Mycobacterium tuberculosis]
MVAGDIACPAILVIDQPAELGAARDQGNAVRSQSQRLCLGIGEREEAVAAGHDAHIHVGQFAEPDHSGGLFESSQ